jgi:hypothetical protein
LFRNPKEGQGSQRAAVPVIMMVVMMMMMMMKLCTLEEVYWRFGGISYR